MNDTRKRRRKCVRLEARVVEQSLKLLQPLRKLYGCITNAESSSRVLIVVREMLPDVGAFAGCVTQFC